MAIDSVTTPDSLVNSYIGIIRSAEFGRDARSAMANSVDRCYTIAVIRAGGPKNGVTRDKIDEHIERIRTAVYGEEVRDALRTGIVLCYSARGIDQTNTIINYLANLIDAQRSEDLKNAILRSIAQCCQDVRTNEN